ncbi:bifunctional (p)ppGpp synthetase/guanosine-3',5'-bis(diphosphate) 3'-pyrophosphohydrolase [Bordetella sp. N]|uniref:RelA/SpoT family protein n=1 Tax=Bordetella sp. N TaxID=1746199 RepID=UPI0007089F03|nr:bifunctional (p)ppGpp synthetase/guanosine-3',5'-bis(diphosphate) 3'-pyrophosphohydrolase [Bordetella sp. N]ALM83969.1 GTP pyrophosphokinase [Bordetella sp. N]
MSAPSAPESPQPAGATDSGVGLDAAWLDAAAAGLDAAGRAQLERAARSVADRFAGQQSITGEPLDVHAAGVARVLASLHTDAATRVAAVLAALPADLQTPPQNLRIDPVAAEFGDDVARLVQGAHALLRLGVMARHASDSAADTGTQKEMQRKMLLAMAADLRIVLMRLASRLQSLRWHAATKVPCDPRLARETLDLYAPLANRLGIWQIKWEMEDLAFRFTDPDRYKQIAKLLEEKRIEREAFIRGAVARMEEALEKAGIVAEVSGRPKHIYSIWNKMRVKKLDFSHLYDLRALRVIVGDVRDCYAALALVHAMWTPVGQEFDDYISRPKPNGYRSLHTVVADADGKPFEVQIRTREMHQFAEYGMAAHWRYKEAGARGGQVSASSDYDRQLAWMRQLLAWNSDVETVEETAVAPATPAAATARKAAKRTDADSGEHIYVLTPQARVIELPAGSTAVDFAYHLHTDLGHRCRGARVDGQLVPLQTQLATGQTVEIVAAKAGGPSRDWLNPQLGFLASPRARSKVRAWFNAIELQQRITQGQALVEKELQRLGKTAVNLEQLAQQLGFARADDLYLAAAKDEFSLRQIDTVFQQPGTGEPQEPQVVTHASRAESTEKSGKSGVLVVGVGSLMTQLARCCRPAPPDTISGFVTRGRGVSIHRTDCHSYAALASREPERVIEVTWGKTGGTLYPVDVSIRAHDRSGLLRDLSEVFARLRLNVIGVNTQSRSSLAHMVFTVEVPDGEALSRALVALTEVTGVTSAGRK